MRPARRAGVPRVYLRLLRSAACSIGHFILFFRVVLFANYFTCSRAPEMPPRGAFFLLLLLCVPICHAKTRACSFNATFCTRLLDYLLVGRFATCPSRLGVPMNNAITWCASRKFPSPLPRSGFSLGVRNILVRSSPSPSTCRGTSFRLSAGRQENAKQNPKPWID